jgi:hypothetical protein
VGDGVIFHPADEIRRDATDSQRFASPTTGFIGLTQESANGFFRHCPENVAGSCQTLDLLLFLAGANRRRHVAARHGAAHSNRPEKSLHREGVRCEHSSFRCEAPAT